MRNLRDTIFYVKTNVLQNFYICISVPLKSKTYDFLFCVLEEVSFKSIGTDWKKWPIFSIGICCQL